jgi:uncharacterized membrane protein
MFQQLISAKARWLAFLVVLLVAMMAMSAHAVHRASTSDHIARARR